MRITSFEEYKKQYKRSVENPESFWEEIANHFDWEQKWTKVLEYDFHIPKVTWFKDAKLNITKNILERNLENRANKIAVIWEPNDPQEPVRKFTYRQLYEEVNRMANVLKNNGIQKGDRVCMYMPMVPELLFAVLASARIGAVHSVVFAGFSSKSLATRINDASCKMLITADGAFRGNKIVPLKDIADEALKETPSVETVLVLKRTGEDVQLQDNQKWLHEELKKASTEFEPEIMDAEDPLFILYTSGSTGKPKGMVHTTGGYMVGTAFTFLNVFQYEENDIFWCTADIGWITGHSYIAYGPLLNGATIVMFEGVPTWPHPGRFWEVVEKHKVTHFYTAPTAIRALEKYPIEWVEKFDLSTLKVLGTVGEPINQEAWEWYYKHVGKEKAPIVDTWWQTETGAIMISNLAGVTPMKPTFATLPLPGIQPVLMDDQGNEIEGNPAEGRLAIKFPWPSMARTIYGDHERFKKIYFSTFSGKYFTGDGALRDENGFYRITGRVDDIVIVSGHNLSTAPIENVIDEHPQVVEAAVVGYPHPVKGNALYGFIILYDENQASEDLKKEINELIAKQIGPIAKLEKIQFVTCLPKTRSGKIMRRILRKIAAGDTQNLGDTSTLLNPDCVQKIMQGAG